MQPVAPTCVPSTIDSSTFVVSSYSATPAVISSVATDWSFQEPVATDIATAQLSTYTQAPCYVSTCEQHTPALSRPCVPCYTHIPCKQSAASSLSTTYIPWLYSSIAPVSNGLRLFSQSLCSSGTGTDLTPIACSVPFSVACPFPMPIQPAFPVPKFDWYIPWLRPQSIPAPPGLHLFAASLRQGGTSLHTAPVLNPMHTDNTQSQLLSLSSCPMLSDKFSANLVQQLHLLNVPCTDIHAVLYFYKMLHCNIFGGGQGY